MKNRIQVNTEDPFIDHATKECCAYVCDIVAYLNLRFSPKVANDVLRSVKLRLAEDNDHWAEYTENQAPKVVQETRTLLGFDEAS